jgi:phospholipase B1
LYWPSILRPFKASRLRPADIEVLGALGDSLTAGFGAKASTVYNLFTDFRGVSYASTSCPRLARSLHSCTPAN